MYTVLVQKDEKIRLREKLLDFFGVLIYYY